MAAEVSSFVFTSDYSVDMLHLIVWCDLAWTGEKFLHIEPLKVALGKKSEKATSLPDVFLSLKTN